VGDALQWQLYKGDGSSLGYGEDMPSDDAYHLLPQIISQHDLKSDYRCHFS